MLTSKSNSKYNAFPSMTQSKSSTTKIQSQKSGVSDPFIQGLLIAIPIYFGMKWYMRRRKASKDESAKLERKLVDGFVDERFEKVFIAFRDNFQEGLETEGAALCIYYQGQMVVDMWGGWSDREAAARWNQQTLVNISTASRAIIAVSFANMIEKEYFNYGDLITKVWPEYAAHEKDATKIRMVLDDTSGISNVGCKIERKHLQNNLKMCKNLESRKSDWTPGTQLGYAIFTSGFVADNICRKADARKRGIAEYFRDEIAKPYHLDVYLTLPSKLEERTARIFVASKWSFFRRCVFSWNLADSYINLGQLRDNSYFKSALNGLEIGRLYLKGKTVLNNPEWRHLNLPSIGGVASAQGLAKMMSLLIEAKLCSRRIVERMRKPKFEDTHDHVLLQKASRGHGFVYTKNPHGDWLMGFPAHGGSNVKADLKNQLAFAYVTNGQKVGIGDDVTAFARLQKAIYQCI